MSLIQKTELRTVLAPQLRQSLNVLTVSLLDLKTLIDEEMVNNPCLEELPPEAINLPPISSHSKQTADYNETYDKIVNKKASLEDILLRQLGMFTSSDLQILIGQALVGNIDDNGYLKITLEEVAQKLGTTLEEVEKTLRIIQQFDPAGIAARNIPECLMLQLERSNKPYPPVLEKIICEHLDDVAKKNYKLIAKSLNLPVEDIESMVKLILKLDPKPARNYSNEEIMRVIPDIILEQKGDDLELTLEHEYIPTLIINKSYRQMLKNNNLDPQTKEYITAKLRSAYEIIRAISKRKSTLRMVIEKIIEIQKEAIQTDLSLLKPLTFQDLAKDLNVHETTICRTVMNKYVKTPDRTIALKDFFTNGVNDDNGNSISTNYLKKLIKELIEQEDKKHPLSDDAIASAIQAKHNLKIARRTVNKYREEMKILSTAFRRER
jgi:RNA polymerase sigma-54 factor